MCIRDSYDGKAGLPNFPEFGLEFAIGSQFTNLSYYGYGAEESYLDQLPGAYLGRYETSVEKTFAPYLMPQESGNHYGTREFTVSDDCLLYTSQKLFDNLLQISLLVY